MGLGVTAGVVAKNLSAPAAAGTHIVLGQGGAALQYSGHRGGVQTVDGGLQAAPAAVGPDDRPTTTVAPADIALQYDTRGFTQGGASAPTAQLAPNSFLGPDAQERNSQLAASMRVLKAHGYI
jgi:hypothetical protein